MNQASTTPFPAREDPPGRNDPCWCGSGLKYKRCHLAEDRAGGDSAAPRGRPVPRPLPRADWDGMRRAGEANGRVLDMLREHVRPGISTADLDRLAHDFIRDQGWTPACLGYKGYPKTLCISRNEVVCHGIPSEQERLQEGDIVNIDSTVIVDGFYGDSSETFLIGEVDEAGRELVRTTAEATLRGIAAVRPGGRLRDVAAAIQPFAEGRGYSVVREFTGHGIGRRFHDSFSVYHHLMPGMDDFELQPGHCFTIEPMINIGGWAASIDPADGWTARTRDGLRSAQFEHTVLVTDDGVEPLTLTPRQRAAGVWLIVDGLELKP